MRGSRRGPTACLAGALIRDRDHALPSAGVCSSLDETLVKLNGRRGSLGQCRSCAANFLKLVQQLSAEPNPQAGRAFWDYWNWPHIGFATEAWSRTLACRSQSLWARSSAVESRSTRLLTALSPQTLWNTAAGTSARCSPRSALATGRGASYPQCFTSITARPARPNAGRKRPVS